ncbi:MAG: FAD-dependent oxidoreductase [Peptococcaceae bacterium]|jgi:heterodisulfide reductase subunit A|nr:FAD-dependent oxidoreductase [Peptococcaceae bacterium]
MVVGAGIAGIQASLDLAESGYYVYLVERSSAIGGTMPMLDKTFPTNDCSMCILSPKLVDAGRHRNIKVVTLAEVREVAGEAGDFSVTLGVQPRYVDPDKCKSCGECADACPQDVPDAYNQGLSERKAVFKLYAQAFPNAYTVDKENCLDCGACVDACQADAIDHGMEGETLRVQVGSIIMAPGFTAFDPKALEYYGYGRLPNVVTSLEFERILSASGPYAGHLKRPSDGREPQKIAWIQCVGSRNRRIEHGYCSSVCCMYAVKEAVIAKEHSAAGLDTTIFFMDMRTYGKGFEKYYNRARDENGVRFVRSRIYEVRPGAEDAERLLIRYGDEQGVLRYEEFDMVVLSVGMEPAADAVTLARKMGLPLNQYNFLEPAPLSGVATAKPGIYVAGAFAGPRDIPETVTQASAAVGESGLLLAEARGTMVSEREFPPERDVAGEQARIGVFVCNCGINIGSVVNVPEVVEYARKLPNVVLAEGNLYSCSQDSLVAMGEAIAANKLNRVVVASCSPRTHRPLFQETLREANLNPELFEMTNIRDQCSWVHQAEKVKATAKARDLVRMAVAKAALREPVRRVSVPVTKAALVVGGGVAGLTSALTLAGQGYQVHLVEKENSLGGLAMRFSEGLRGEDTGSCLREMIAGVESHPLITVYTGREIAGVAGYVGNVVTTLTDGREIRHGVTVLATGGEAYSPTEYLYGRDGRILTNLELDEKLAELAGAKTFVFIQCVGSREPGRPYCSRVCCSNSVKTALKLKKEDPGRQVFILYRDVRTYGILEELYEEARRSGVIFVRYDVDDKPVVSLEDGRLKVTVTEPVLGDRLVIDADILSLAAAIKPAAANTRLSQLFKVPLNEDGFFLEAHLKLRPVDFASDGVFMAGVAHAPKNLEENIAQAKAAAGRACTILAKDRLESHGVVAVVDPAKCAACLTCVRLCPYNAPRIADYAATIEAVLCQGCGTCAGECPNKAITLQSYNDKTFVASVDGLFTEVS